MFKKLLLSFGMILGFGIASQAQYCVPVYTSSCTSDDYIDLFTTTGGASNIATNVSTGCNNTTNNYTYHSASSMSQVQGQTINFSVQGGAIFSSGFRIWVDWNNDQDFADAGEDVWNSVTSGTTLYTGSLTIPLSASPGLKRLRVRSNYAGVPVTDACATSSFGEAEEFNLTVLSLGPCLAVPFVGLTNSDKNITCPGENFTLSIDTMTFGSGQHYQWQKSANGTVWTDMTNDTNLTKTTNQATTNSYRLRVTCGNGTPVYSTAKTVTTTAVALAGGTYTINGLAVTGGSNFASFSDFTQAITCGGIGGPIVLNVMSKGTAYNEQLNFGAVNGTSATNTITINGNNDTITFGGSAANPGTVIFNGTQYVKIKKLNIIASGTASSYGVEFRNNAKYIEIDSCLIRANKSSTSSTVNAIVMSNMVTSPTTAGLAASNVTIKNNIIEGGYYCFVLNGPTAAPWSVNNVIENNKIQDFFLYGLYVRGQENTIIKNNDINRSTRAAISTFYGMYFTGGIQGLKVTGNHIHDILGQSTNLNYSAYGLYFVSAIATATNPAVFSNNIINDLGTTGTTYGIYVSSGERLDFYHNTVSIDNQNAATSTSGQRVFTSFASAGGMNIKNNIFNLTHSGAGTKYVIYISNSTPTYVIDNNQYNLGTTTGAVNFGYFTSNVATYTAWKAVNNSAYDQNSKLGDPIFAPDEITPQSSIGNAAGANLMTLVPNDFFGIARTATPDIGAIEYVPLSCLRPLGFTGSSSSTTITTNWTNDPDADSVKIEYGPTGFNQGTGIAINVSGSSFTASGLTSQACYDFYVTTWCNGVLGNGTTLFTYCTKCGAKTVPLVEDFNTTPVGTSALPSVPECWSLYKNSANLGYAYTYAFSTPNSLPNHFYMYNSSSTADTLALISPAISGMSAGDKQMRFFAKTSSTLPRSVIVATMGSPDLKSSLHILDTIAVNATYTEYTYIFNAANGYNGTDQYMVLMHGNGGTFTSVYLDDINIESVPSCNPPFGIAASTITTSSAAISWGSVSGNCFKLEYGAQGFTHSTGQGTVVQNVTSPKTISGLSPNTRYDVYIFDCCDTLNPAGPFTFKTNCLSQLSGTYTVGGTVGPNNFVKLADAISVLADCGISGPVTFNMAAGTDSTGMILNGILGSSTTNTVTFNGVSPAAKTIVLPTGVQDGFDLSGNLNIIFKNFTLSGENANRLVWLHNNATNVTFDNVHLLGSTTTTTYNTGCIIASDVATSPTTAGNNFTNLTVKNCKISGNYYGISVYGQSSTLYNTGLKIENNTFEDQYYYAIYSYYLSNVSVNGNKMLSIRNSFGYGFNGSYINNLQANANYFNASGYGMYLYYINVLGAAPAVASEVINNMALGGSYGIYLYNGNKINLYHNTLKGGSYGLYLYNGNDFNVRNNIFSGSTSSIYSGIPAPLNIVLDYNIYQSNAATNLVVWGGTTYATLAAWKTAAPALNMNSLAGDPGFLSAIDLHIVGTLPNNVGVNGLATVDIDGDARPATGSTIVDIGADEFTPLTWDASVEGMIVNLAGCGDSTTEVSLIVKNFGLNTLTSVPMTVQVTGGVTATLTQTATTSIPTGVTDTLLVGTFNTYSGPSGVLLKGFTNLASDQKHSNDTITKGPGNYFPVEPRTHGLVDTVCASLDSVDLYALNVPGANYGWFAAAAGGTALANGDTFRVPTSGQTTYFVQYTSAMANVEFGLGALASNSTFITPYKTFYMDGRAQYMILASELQAQGVAGGSINSMQFEVSGTPDAQPLNDFNIKMGGTSLANLSGGYVATTGFTNVYYNASYTTSASWNTHTFTTPFIWNGVDNVIIEVCFDNSAYGSNTNVTYDVTPFVSSFDGYQDVAAGSVCGTTPISNTASSNRPRMRFNATTTSCSNIRKPVSFALKAGGVASAAYTATVQANGATVDFDASASVATSYVWNFGDGSIPGTGVTPSHTYTNAGTYTVCLYVSETNCNSADTICKTVTATVGIEESLLGQSLNVYPNPNNGQFRISFMVEGVKHTNIRVMNAMGQLMYDYTPGNISGAYTQDLNLSREAAGVYILQITTDDGIISRRITIRK